MTKLRFPIFMALAVAVLALPWAAQATNYANTNPLNNQLYIPKFVDPLPAIPIATPDTGSFLGADYYKINAIQTNWKFSSSANLYPSGPGSKVRGYVQDPSQAGAPPYSYLGPMIVAQAGRPVRVLFTNGLPADNSGTQGNLFLPVDTNLMGAGMAPIKDNLGTYSLMYSQNRTTFHLHGGVTPWISDGTPHQWITPGGETILFNGAPSNVWTTPALIGLAKGASQQNVPDMANPGNGAETLYFSNGALNSPQSGRLQFYHDHAFGLTRLHIYAGLAAPYVIYDQAEKGLLGTVIPTGGGLPQAAAAGGINLGIPLVIQDKTFVPPDIGAAGPLQTGQDVDTTATITLANGTTVTQNLAGWSTVAASWGGSNPGDLWFPHVYEFNQSGTFGSGAGANPQGRWDYGPYTWPPATIAASSAGFANVMNMPIPLGMGDVRSPSAVPEAFMDTMVVNGKAYPTIQVDTKSYRFRILNACNDRTVNLQTYFTDNCGPFPAPQTTAQMGVAPYASNITLRSPSVGTEVSMVKADGAIYGLTDGSITNNPVSPNTYPSPVQFGNPVQNNELNPNPIPPSTLTNQPTPLFFPLPAALTSVNGPIAASTPTVTVPFDGRVGGVPDPRQMGPQMIVIGSEGGLLPYPIVLANNCIDYIYDRKQITFGNVRNYALQTPNPSLPSQTLNYMHPGYNLHLGPAQRADVVIDFSTVPDGSTIVLYNDNAAPEPGFDPRYDYYTGNPDYSNSLLGMGMGGAPTTQPGFGPNTRTVMLFKVVKGSDPGNTNQVGTNLLTGLQTQLPQYFNNNQPPLPIAQQRIFGTLNPQDNYAAIQNITSMTSRGVTIPILNKSIAEDFDPIWGRMNAMLGTEQASTNSQGQQTFGFHFSDLYTEMINPFNAVTAANPGIIATPVPDTSTYGTQIWKVTHNGVDTHSIHVHLFNIQLINRVDWAGVVKPADPNEAGWNETVRMNPLEDIYVALQPKIPLIPQTWNGGKGIPNSVRPLDPTMPIGIMNSAFGGANQFWTAGPAGAVVPNFPFTNPGPNPANPPVGATMVNNYTDFGWEYVWHCHLLGHEENDMMRAINFQVAPSAPTNLTASLKGFTVTLTWTNTEAYQSSFSWELQRSTDPTFATNIQVDKTIGGGTNNPGTTYTTTDTLPNVKAKMNYYYRVRAYTTNGSSAWIPLPPGTVSVFK